jgi:hypothetical protein
MSNRAHITATVSGSFHRHLSAIGDAVDALRDAGVHVLSPKDPRVVAAAGEFLFVASDAVRSVRLVEDKHLEALRGSSFLWLVTPDGYVGQSASLEIGAAVAFGVPIFSLNLPFDVTLRQYVSHVQSISEAIGAVAVNGNRSTSFLIDPHASVDNAHVVLEQLRSRYELLPRCEVQRSALSALRAERLRAAAAITSLVPVGSSAEWILDSSRHSDVN